MSNTNTRNNTLIRFGTVACKCIQIICWIGAAMLLFVAVASLFNADWTTQNLISEGGVTVNGVAIAVNDPAGKGVHVAMLVAFIGGIVGFVLESMIFGNMHSVLKTAQSGSPFQPANVKRIEQIGYLSIALPVLGFVITTLCKLVGGPDALEISIDLTGVVMGLLVLCLSQFFAHGVQLENDVDGLV